MIPNPPKVADMPKSEPVPEALYYIRCDKATYKISKEKKVPMAECQFTIFGPEEAEEFHGRKLFENLMLSGKGMFRTRQFLEAAGKDDSFVLDDTEGLLTLECAAAVQLEPERPDPENPERTFPARNSIARFLPIGG